MILKNDIKKELENTFHIEFEIIHKIEPSLEKYLIYPKGSKDSLFKVEASILNNTRLTVICEPQKYAAEFVKNISSSTLDKRSLFCSYWEEILKKEKRAKLSVLLNDNERTPDYMLNLYNVWSKFKMRYTISPYYDNTNEKNKNVVFAIKMIVAMILSLTTYTIKGYDEGKELIVKSKKYERNPINRELCILTKGTVCSVCGFQFKDMYGAIGDSFIEVHHQIPISKFGEEHEVNITTDLFPVCPNCHSMLHKKNPPYTIEELKEIIDNYRKV